MVAHFVIENKGGVKCEYETFSKCHWIPGIKISGQSGYLLKTHIICPYFILFDSESVGKKVPL